jgi:hypothetical protein
MRAFFVLVSLTLGFVAIDKTVAWMNAAAAVVADATTLAEGHRP